MKTDVGSIVRTIVFILAWVNQFLATKNISPIPVDEVTISSIITGQCLYGLGGKIITSLTQRKKDNKSYMKLKLEQILQVVRLKRMEMISNGIC